MTTRRAFLSLLALPAAAVAAEDPIAAAIREQMRASFYDDSDAWRGLVYGQARATVLQALRGLAGPR